VYGKLSVCLFLRYRWGTLYRSSQLSDPGFDFPGTLLNIIRYPHHPVHGKREVIAIITQEHLWQNEQAIRKVNPELGTWGERVKSKSAKEYGASASSGWPLKMPSEKGSIESAIDPGQLFEKVQTARRLRKGARESHQIGLESSTNRPAEILIGTSSTNIAANEKSV